MRTRLRPSQSPENADSEAWQNLPIQINTGKFSGWTQPRHPLSYQRSPHGAEQTQPFTSSCSCSSCPLQRHISLRCVTCSSSIQFSGGLSSCREGQVSRRVLFPFRLENKWLDTEIELLLVLKDLQALQH